MQSERRLATDCYGLSVSVCSHWNAFFAAETMSENIQSLKLISYEISYSRNCFSNVDKRRAVFSVFLVPLLLPLLSLSPLIQRNIFLNVVSLRFITTFFDSHFFTIKQFSAISLVIIQIKSEKQTQKPNNFFVQFLRLISFLNLNYFIWQ